MTSTRHYHLTRRGLALLGLILLHGMAGASDAESSASAVDSRIVLQGRVVSDDELDSTRGGFLTADGLRLNFGIERRVMLNGQEIYGLRLQYADGELRLHTAGESGQSAAASTRLGTHLNAGAITLDNATQSLPAFVLQNAIDGQAIRAITTIQVDINSLSNLRNQQLFESLRQTIGGNFGR